MLSFEHFGGCIQAGKFDRQYIIINQQANEKLKKLASGGTIAVLQEDRALMELHVSRGVQSWSRICKILAQQFKILNKTPKVCRERFLNHLDPSINRQQWSQREESALLALHCELGNRWAQIARRLPGRQVLLYTRTDNSVKNKFYSKYRRAIKNVNLLLGRCRYLKLKQLKIPFVYKVINFLEGKDRPRSAHQAELVQNALFIKNEIITFEEIELNRIEKEEGFKNKLEELARRIHGFNCGLKRKGTKKKMGKASKINEPDLQSDKMPLQAEKHESGKANACNDTADTPCKEQCGKAAEYAAPSLVFMHSPGKRPETEYLSHLFSGMCVENEDNFWNLSDCEIFYSLQSH